MQFFKLKIEKDRKQMFAIKCQNLEDLHKNTIL